MRADFLACADVVANTYSDAVDSSTSNSCHALPFLLLSLHARSLSPLLSRAGHSVSVLGMGDCRHGAVADNSGLFLFAEFVRYLLPAAGGRENFILVE